MACGGFFGKALLAPQLLGPANAFWVAVDGKPDNNGSRELPLDLSTALSVNGPVRPGDTVWIRGGTYRGTFQSTLTGTAAAPIVVRQAPGERATIDSAESGRDALTVDGGHTWFWGFEITSSDPKRQTAESGPWPGDLRRGYGAVTRAPGIRFINLVVHDNANGLGLWSEALASEAYGNIIYNNGWQGPDRAHGHGIYTQNAGGVRRLADNVVFNQFSHGIHAYGSGKAHLDDITLDGNIAFNNGALAASPEYERNLLLGGGRPAANPRLVDNITYFGVEKTSGENNLGHDAGCTNFRAQGNYLVGGRPLVLRNCEALTFVDNTLVGRAADDRPQGTAGNSFSMTAPTGTRVFVRPNRCEAGRAHVAVFNWDEAAEVGLDLSGTSLVVGERFVVRDVQDLFGPPAVDAIYDGRDVRVAMTGRRIEPPFGEIGRRPGHTAPQFAVFLVSRHPAVADHSDVADCSIDAVSAGDGESAGRLQRLINWLGF